MHHPPPFHQGQQEAAVCDHSSRLPWCGKSSVTARDVCLIALLAAAIRVAMHLVYEPWLNIDSIEYLNDAVTLMDEPGRYDGIRSPGYPLFLGMTEWLAGSDFHELLSPLDARIVAMAQSLGGMLAAILLYLSMARMGIRRLFALPAALFFAVLVPLGTFEMGILSESLSVLCVTLLFWLLAVIIGRIEAGRPFGCISVVTGFIGGIAALVRLNNFVFMGAAIGCIAAFAVLQWLKRQGSSARALARLCVMAGLGLSLPLSGCLLFIHYTTGAWTLTSRSSLVMAVTAYNLFDRVEPQDRVLGDIIQDHYLARIRNDKIDRNYLLGLMPNLMDHAFQMPFPQDDPFLKRARLELYIGDVAMRLLLKNRDIWLENGLSNIPDTFRFKVMDVPTIAKPQFYTVNGGEPIISPWGQRGLGILEDAEQWLMLACYLMTGAAMLVSGIRYFRSGGARLFDAMVPFVLAAAAVASMLSCCFFGIYVPRYGISFYPILIASAAWLCQHCKRGAVAAS